MYANNIAVRTANQTEFHNNTVFVCTSIVSSVDCCPLASVLIARKCRVLPIVSRNSGNRLQSSWLTTL